MRTVNLYVLTRAKKEAFQETYKALSHSTDCVKPTEYEDISALVECLLLEGCRVSMLDDFWYSYRIPHISKEFDLLKLSLNHQILNIELKSKSIGLEKITRQLRQNQAYLKYLETPMISYTFVGEDRTLYKLVGDVVVRAEMSELLQDIAGFNQNVVCKHLNDYFKPNMFLVSPLTQPEKLLYGEYFLTNQQKSFKSKILSGIAKEPKIYGITGEPGTGKTLLLYDLAKELAKKKNCCIIHGAELSAAHKELDEKLEHVSILSSTGLTPEVLDDYDVIFVDEMQRVFDKIPRILDRLIGRKPMILSFDQEQILLTKQNAGLPYILTDRACEILRLTSSLRISKQVASFYKCMFHKKAFPRGKFDYSCIDIVYAGDEEAAKQIIRLYTRTYGYHFLYANKSFSVDEGYGSSTQEIIGQEFDRVITWMSSAFYYSKEGILCAQKQADDVYDPIKALYQNVTRTREKLCICVYQNDKMYQELVALKNCWLE